MDRRDRGPYDLVASGSEPAGLFRRQSLHVAAQRFDEESFGHFRQKHGSARPPTAGFRDQVANRMLEPLAGHVVSQTDLDYHRETGKKKAGCITLSTDKPTYQTSTRPTTAILQRETK